MKSAKSVGRLIGIMLFVQLVGLSLPFILLMPATTSGFLENAAAIAFQVKVAVFLLFANAALTIGIAVAAFPLFREHSYSMGLWLLAFSVMWFSLQAVDNAHILSMLSLSQQFAGTSASKAELFQAVGAVARSTRRWVHYTELLVIDIWFFLFYSLLFRFGLVPRALAGFGVLAVLLHTAGITLPMFLGYSSVMPLGFSLALSHLAMGTWLLAKGFKQQLPNQTPN
jgi:hypothetical protein